MKIRAEVSTTTTKEIEVEFPLFIQYGDSFESGGWYDTYKRFEADGTWYSVTEHGDRRWEYEYNDVRGAGPGSALRSNIGYHLITEKHEIITAAKFHEVVGRFALALGKIPK